MIETIVGRWVARQTGPDGIPSDRGKVLHVGGKTGGNLLVAREETGLVEWWPVDSPETEGGRPVFLVDEIPVCDEPPDEPAPAWIPPAPGDPE